MRFYKHLLNPRDFGGATTYSLQFSTQLESLIAYDFSLQYLAAVQKSVISLTPDQDITFLEKALSNPNGPVYTIGVHDPTGGHAVYVDAKAMLPHLAASQYPAQALCVALYLAAGIRAVEIGSVMFGKPDGSGGETPSAMELVRLTFPRRVYTQSHVDYVAGAFVYVKAAGADVKGMKIVQQSPALRHFTARFEPTPFS